MKGFASYMTKTRTRHLLLVNCYQWIGSVLVCAAFFMYIEAMSNDSSAKHTDKDGTSIIPTTGSKPFSGNSPAASLKKVPASTSTENEGNTVESIIKKAAEEHKIEFPLIMAIIMTESGFDRVISASYELLGLVTFFTIASAEVRAWPVPGGTEAPVAAGKIHTDMERGFIRAEVISFDDLVKSGSLAEARRRGLLRTEGKTYTVQDGDVITFLFNV